MPASPSPVAKLRHAARADLPERETETYRIRQALGKTAIFQITIPITAAGSDGSVQQRLSAAATGTGLTRNAGAADKLYSLAITMFASVPKKKRLLLLIGSVLVLIAPFAVYKLIGYIPFLVLSTHYKSYIPTSFEIDESIFAGHEIGGFLEGCGIAIFKLSENTSANIASGGVVFLNQNSMISDSAHEPYKRWKEAEREKFFKFQGLLEEDAGGNTCTDVPNPLKSEVLSAIDRPGVFYSGFNEDTELIVIPSLRLAVFSHNR